MPSKKDIEKYIKHIREGQKDYVEPLTYLFSILSDIEHIQPELRDDIEYIKAYLHYDLTEKAREKIKEIRKKIKYFGDDLDKAWETYLSRKFYKKLEEMV